MKQDGVSQELALDGSEASESDEDPFALDDIIQTYCYEPSDEANSQDGQELTEQDTTCQVRQSYLERDDEVPDMGGFPTGRYDGRDDGGFPTEEDDVFQVGEDSDDESDREDRDESFDHANVYEYYQELGSEVSSIAPDSAAGEQDQSEATHTVKTSEPAVDLAKLKDEMLDLIAAEHRVVRPPFGSEQTATEQQHQDGNQPNQLAHTEAFDDQQYGRHLQLGFDHASQDNFHHVEITGGNNPPRSNFTEGNPGETLHANDSTASVNSVQSANSIVVWTTIEITDEPAAGAAATDSSVVTKQPGRRTNMQYVENLEYEEPQQQQPVYSSPFKCLLFRMLCIS